ncbi:MAG: ribonuclease H-like domain-containing protein, partial [Candidatus Thorarchaeota archaeon]
MAILAPVKKMRKDQIVWLQTNKCRHNHTYLEHYNCFMDEVADGMEHDWKNAPIPDKIGYFDIETTDFKANIGMMLCYCILDNDTGEILERTIDGVTDMTSYRKFVKEMDKDVITQMVEDLRKFDRVITYYGTRFDIPFARTRSMFWKLDFPEFQELTHTDVYYMVRSKLKLSRSSMEMACRTLLGDDMTN